MYRYKTSENLDRILSKLYKKDKKLYESLLKKIDEIINSTNIEHYKNLRYSLKEYKRAHVGSFVLIFKYDKQQDIVLFDDFDHHDSVYKK